ncbi:MAG: hypothetical protein M3Y30_01930, partial [Gemmatimonadota bacterium]|nr:hypothetical protein [Gemmatimonadota bacterium]
MFARMSLGRLGRIVLLIATFGAHAAAAQTTSVQRVKAAQASIALDSSAAWGAHLSPPGTCQAALTAADMTGVSIYLYARMAPHAEEILTSQADLIAHDVVVRLRGRLGGSDSVAPDIGSSIRWYAIPAELVLVARANGAMTWHGLSESGDTAAVALVSTALDSARRRGGAMMLWPEGFAADSVVVRLTLTSASYGEDSSFTAPNSKRVRFRAFSMLAPTFSPAVPMEDLDIKYPAYNERHHVVGYLLTQFVVDTNGTAIMPTFKD